MAFLIMNRAPSPSEKQPTGPLGEYLRGVAAGQLQAILVIGHPKANENNLNVQGAGLVLPEKLLPDELLKLIPKEVKQ